ncbi:MAG: Xaa-Pro peptidase family protein [Ktedonobacterales bacterium]
MAQNSNEQTGKAQIAQTAQATPTEYARRLAAARARIAAADLDGLLISSQYNRRYLTGFTPTDHDITESAGLALVTPHTFALLTSTFALNGIEHEIAPSGVTALLTDTKLITQVLVEALKADGAVKRLGFEQDRMAYGTWEQFRKALDDANTGVELVPTDDLIVHVRASKDDAEIAVMRRAAAIANDAFALLLNDLHVGMTERQIAATLERHMIDLGADEPSFPTIVACGKGGALPHWVPSDRAAQAGEPILIDFGCRVDGYCSDLTRTICIGEPDAKLVEIYSIVRRAQDAAVEALQSGVRRGRDVDGAARKVIADAGYGEEFMHGLGHGVGLAVHELPAAGWLRINTPEMDERLSKVEQIGADNVVTNEPGIYITGWGGVRLEDMLLVHADGVELFTDRNPEQIVSVPVR